MSKTRDAEDEFAEYRTTSGAETKTVDISSDDNPLKQAIGDEDASKERKYDASLSGERFVQFYENTAAGLREYIANAETACIRRARFELQEAGMDDEEIPSDVDDLLDLASDKVDYEPQIDVVYREQGDAPTLVIEDNGIGISTHEYQVVQRVGYSTSHMNGQDVGNFGVGWLSGFLFTGVNGCFKQYTKSRKTDESYATLEYVSNFEYLDAEKESYGTRFVFPEFSSEMKRVNVTSKIEDYASGLRVPLVYRKFDASGAETNASEEYAPRKIESKYDDDSFKITYEDEYFKAVMSPSGKSKDIETFNVSMPIRRNACDRSDTYSFKAHWQYDYLGKREDGPIVHCPSKPSIEGMIPIPDTKYEQLTSEHEAEHVRNSDIPDDAVIMAEPASSRDSFESGNEDYWEYVSECLQEKWVQRTSEILSQTDDWDDFISLDLTDRLCVLKAYKVFVDSYSRTDPSNVQSQLQDKFGVSVSTDYCEKIDRSRNSVMVVPEGHKNPRLKRPAKRNKMEIQEVLDEYPDGVYMAKLPSKKKCDIAWGLGETAVIRLSKGTSYEKYTGLGFKKLKSLPSTNLSEKLPNLDDEIIEKYESSDKNDDNSSQSSTSRQGRNPETKQVKVRVGDGNTKYMSTRTVNSIMDRLDSGKELRVGQYSISSIIIYDQTELDYSTPPKTYKREANIGVTAVPKYVYEYLKEQSCDNIYFTKDDAYAEHRAREKQMVTGKKTNPDVIVFVSDTVKNENITVRSLINEYTSESIDRDELIIVHDISVRDDMSFYDIDYDARMISINGGYVQRMFEKKFNHTKTSVDFVDLTLEKEIPDADLDSDYFNQVFNVSRKSYLSKNDSRLEKGIEIVKEMGGKFPDQD